MQPASALSPERIETAFELRWRLVPGAAASTLRDPGYELLLGRLYERLRGQYPQLAELPAARISPEAAPWVPRQRFASARTGGALVQVGPGVLALNQLGAAPWSEFEPRLEGALAALFSAYPREPAPLTATEAALCLVHAIPVDANAESVLGFLRETLHTRLELDPALFEDPTQAGKPVGLALNLAFALSPRLGRGTIALALRPSPAGPQLVFQLEARVAAPHTPAEPRPLLGWARDAQTLLTRWIRTLAQPEVASRLLGTH